MAISIRHSKDINGIKVEDTELRLSSYADDTTLFLDGTEKSISCTFDILDNFCNASGLKINFDKSEVMKLGPLRYDASIKAVGRGLSWTNGPVKLLGILITYNEIDLFHLNFSPQLEKIRTLLQVWSRRDLTPIGKITIIKSLALSQLTFLLTVLPNPPSEFIKEVNSVIYKFVWNGKPDKIGRKIIINDFEHGGLKMPDLLEFQKGLKCTWIKRYMNCENSAKWKIFFDIPLLKCGLKDIIWDINSKDFPFQILNNSFLADVIRAWLDFKYVSSTSGDIKPTLEVLWYNCKIKIKNKCLFYRDFVDHGILRFGDLLSENGSILSYPEIKAKYHVNCTFIKYYGLLKAIPKSWKRSICDKTNDNTNSLVDTLCNNPEKPSRLVYQTIIDSVAQEPTKCYEKWHRLLGVADLNWSLINQNIFKTTKDPRLQYFQYKFIHFLMPTNVFLVKIGQKESALCSFCKEHPENMLHLFWDCEKVGRFWNELSSWLNEKLVLDEPINFNMILVCFGCLNDHTPVLSLLIFLAKQFIFNQKCQEKPHLNFMAYKNFARKTYQTEKSIAISKEILNIFENKWKNLFE